MKEKEPGFLEFAENIFYEFSQITRGSLNIIFSKRVLFPVLKHDPELEIVIPLPRKQKEQYLFEGILFDDDKNDRENLWCMFLCTIYHIAAHACISKYSLYDSWKKSKTEDVCLKIIDYVEDVYVQQYIAHIDSKLWDNIKNIELKLMSQTRKNVSKSVDVTNHHFSNLSDRERFSMMQTNMLNKHDDAVSFADFLYKNRSLLPVKILPYCERHDDVKQMLITRQRSPNFEPRGTFKENILKLDELWLADKQFKSKILKKYEKNLKDLQFDMILIPLEDFHNFLQIKEKVAPLLRRIRQQIQMMGNLSNESKIDEMGYLNMQLAIQSIASESQFVDVFERDEIRRVEEAWVILVDNSASMSLKFEQIKEFTVCIAETANDLAGKSDAWALFSFNNSFKILKDFDEKYNREVQARIGSLENKGLSLLPDAIELARRILLSDPRERKYIFLITDGHASGYEKINQHLAKITKKLDASGISLIAIGVSKFTSKSFRNSVRGSSNIRQLVSKFITIYKTVSSD